MYLFFSPLSILMKICPVRNSAHEHWVGREERKMYTNYERQEQGIAHDGTQGRN